MRDLTTLEEAMATAKQRLKIWDGYGGFNTPESVVDQANGVADALRTLLTALRSRPSKEDVARVICDAEWAGSQPWDRKAESFKQRYRDVAQAVLRLFEGGE
jgi:hypothetical protein